MIHPVLGKKAEKPHDMTSSMAEKIPYSGELGGQLVTMEQGYLYLSQF